MNDLGRAIWLLWLAAALAAAVVMWDAWRDERRRNQ
jgi:hypothetical protein